MMDKSNANTIYYHYFPQVISTSNDYLILRYHRVVLALARHSSENGLKRLRDKTKVLHGRSTTFQTLHLTLFNTAPRLCQLSVICQLQSVGWDCRV